MYFLACLATIQELNNLLSVTSKTEKVAVSGFRFDKEEVKVRKRKFVKIRVERNAKCEHETFLKEANKRS